VSYIKRLLVIERLKGVFFEIDEPYDTYDIDINGLIVMGVLYRASYTSRESCIKRHLPSDGASSTSRVSCIKRHLVRHRVMERLVQSVFLETYEPYDTYDIDRERLIVIERVIQSDSYRACYTERLSVLS